MSKPCRACIGSARKGAKYETSLELLARAALIPGVETKSAIMLGLGETREEIMQVLHDLRAHNVARLSLGQYLRPSSDNLPVTEYIHLTSSPSTKLRRRRSASAGSRPGRWCAPRTMRRRTNQ